MDFYKAYDMCCIISFCDDDTLQFCGSDLRGVGNTDFSPDRVYRSQSFRYNKYTEETQDIESSKYGATLSYRDQKDSICITSVTHNLYQLYMNKKKPQETPEVNDDDQIFHAIIMYLRSCLNDICGIRRTRIDKVYFVCIIPSRWSQESDIVDLILKPLFVQIGCVLPEDHQDRILFMDELESVLSYAQFSKENYNSKYIFNESRCVMYQMQVNGMSLHLTSTYFQFKEDYNLKVFEDRYYSPKIISINESGSLFSITELNSARRDLKELVWKKLLTNNFTLLKSNGESAKFEDITDGIMEELLQYAAWYLDCCESSNRGRSMNVVTLNIPGDILLEVVEEEMGVSVLSNQFKRAFNFIVEQNTKIPFHRKSLLYSGLFMGLKPYQEDICKIFLFTLEKKIQDYYKEMDQSTWYNFGVNLSMFSSPQYPALVATRKATVSNFALRPLIITKHHKQNMLRIPLYYPIEKVNEKRDTPSSIVYIDISQSTTNVICEAVDETGYINQKFVIDTQSLDKSKRFNLSSLNEKNDTHKLYDSKRIKKTSKGVPTKALLINETSNSTSFRSLFTDYLKSLVLFIRDELQMREIQLEKVGYVLSLEKTMMKDLHMASKDDLMELFKESTGISRDITVINQGEKLVWDELQKVLFEKPLYYVHAHMSTNYIYLKLHQVVDITDSNNGIKKNASVFLKDKLVDIVDSYKLISELLWRHIQSLDEKQRKNYIYCHERNIDNIDDLSKFSEAVTRYLKEKLFCAHTIRTLGDFYDAKHRLDITENCSINFTLQELFNIAIIPVLQQLVNTLVCSLMNEDLFGHYEAATLIVTGSSLLEDNYSVEFHNIITKEMEKELKRLLRELGCKTKCILLVDTSKQTKSDTILARSQDQSFCYGAFLKGDLCVVSDSTYLIRRYLRHRFNIDYDEENYIQLNIRIEYDDSSSVIARGDKLVDRRIKVDAFAVVEEGETNPEYIFEWPAIWRYSEPCSLQEIENGDDFIEFNSFEYTGYSIIPNRISTIQVEALHYSSCIRITLESHGPPLYSHYSSFSLGTRQTLKYF